MKTCLIVAMCDNRGIGNVNGIPWHSKEDLRFFSRVTKGGGANAIVMGRKTWESIGSNPLPGRLNIVLSRSENEFVDNIEAVDRLCLESGINTLWVIGGAQIYSEYLHRDKVDECYITRIPGAYECDTFFPELDDNWESSIYYTSDELVVERLVQNRTRDFMIPNRREDCP